MPAMRHEKISPTDRIFSQAESCVGECHTMGLLGMRKIWKSARSVGDKEAHNALKNRLDVFILPRISQISTDAMRTGGGLNGFPHYETRAISFSPRNRLAAFSPYIYDKKLLEFVRVQQLHYRFIRYQIPSLEQVA